MLKEWVHWRVHNALRLVGCFVLRPKSKCFARQTIFFFDARESISEHCGTGVKFKKRPKPIFFTWNRCKMGQLDVFRLYIFRFGHFGVPRGPPRDSEKSSKSSVKFWREDVGYLIIRPDILNIRPNLFHILESAQPRFITHFRRSKRKVTVLPP